MAVRGLGVDEGTATVKVVEVQKEDGAFVPVRAVSLEAAEDASFDAGALRGVLAQVGVKEKQCVGGLTGKDLVVRYHQVPTVPDWQLRKIMEFEIAEIEKQSGDELAADFNLLPVASDLSSDDTVLLALTREQRVTERTERLKAAGLKVRHYAPNAVALFHAFRVFGPAVSGDVVVASIGRTCSDLVLLRDGELLYARSVNTGGEVLNQALVEQFNVSAAKAEKLKREMGDLRPREQRRDLSPQEEKVSYALEGASGRLFQMVQSTVQFARTQLQLNRLEPARVFLTGGTAAMPGLASYLEASLGIPAAVFDPLEGSGVEGEGPAGRLDYTVALGLALMAADPEAYQLEVQGAAMRRAREFQERHVFSLLAALLIVGYLAFAFVRLGSEHALASDDLRRLSQEQKSRTSNEIKLKSLLEERAHLVERLDVLEKKKAAGEGLERAWAAIVQHLPPELWITRISLALEDPKDRSRQAARSPLVLVEGNGRSIGDRAVDEAYREFVQGVRATLGFADPGQFIDTPPTQRQDFTFSLQFRFLESAEAGTGEQGDG